MSAGTLSMKRSLLGTVLMRATSIEQAVSMFCQYRDSNGLGASEFGPGTYTDIDGRTVQISYNGRTWNTLS